MVFAFATKVKIDLTERTTLLADHADSTNKCIGFFGIDFTWRNCFYIIISCVHLWILIKFGIQKSFSLLVKSSKLRSQNLEKFDTLQ